MNSPALPILATAGRLLLEHNESTGEICRELTSTARTLTDRECTVAVAYGGLSVGLAGEPAQFFAVDEYRYNAALQSQVHLILREVRQGALEPAAALSRLEGLKTHPPVHPHIVTTLLLGIAAGSLAALLGGDLATILVVCAATSLGLFVRRELARRHASLLLLPLAAGFVGALLGGLAIRYGWTQTPQLTLIVPSLMLVPGPHLINGLLDLVDNYVSMSVARLALATSILFAVGLGVFLAVELMLPELPLLSPHTQAEYLNVVLDMLLAGLVTLGFALYYNTASAHLGIVIVGGMAGHGLRFLALQAGCGLVPATFLGSATVGIMAALAVKKYQAPVAVIAFAGAVTMMPGLQIYRALSGLFRIARLRLDTPPELVAATIGEAAYASLIVIALAAGLIVASRTVLLLMDSKPKQT